MHYRTLQCNGNITKVEIVMKREEETPLPEVKIVEPDVKLAESVIEISNTATEDILLEVSKDGFKFTMISSTVMYFIHGHFSFIIKENFKNSFPGSRYFTRGRTLYSRGG